MEFARRGGAWWASCPLHEDKTPSLRADNAENRWHCFSCSEGGDIIALIQAVNECTFPKAMETAAKLAGISELSPEESAGLAKKLRSRRDARENERRAAYWRLQVFFRLCDELRETDKTIRAGATFLGQNGYRDIGEKAWDQIAKLHYRRDMMENRVEWLQEASMQRKQ